LSEIWKYIKGYGRRYQVSNYGHVRSYSTGKVRILSPGRTYSGGLAVSLSINYKSATFQVHQLVAQAFIPNPLNKKEVNHKDFDRTNNNVNNLEWATRQENMDHAVRNGHTRGKWRLTKKEVRAIKTRLNNKPKNQTWIDLCEILARVFDISVITIHQLRSSRIWKNVE